MDARAKYAPGAKISKKTGLDSHVTGVISALVMHFRYFKKEHHRMWEFYSKSVLLIRKLKVIVSGERRRILKNRGFMATCEVTEK